ncbi:hypothetical protein V5F59_01380 [Xanthobacter autotrophicus DSM 431]|uniref:hypothetical protein n=1 Tax=Xanthobacter nonsaccharivorans TaxID=3119912 RepID=UPI00372A18FB
MASNEYKIPTYPVVGFLVRHGILLSLVLGVVPLLAAAGLVASGWALWVLVPGAGASVVLATLLISYIEVLRVISDTLMPK